jgi:hypothetical protein
MRVRLRFRRPIESLEFDAPEDLTKAEISARIREEMVDKGREEEPIAIYVIDRYGVMRLWFPDSQQQVF